MPVPRGAETWPIGAIVRALEVELAEGVGRQPTDQDEDAISAIYDEFDAHFQDRPDYRLWRSALVPYFSVNKPQLRGKPALPWTDWPASAAQCVESSDPVVIWSTVALAPLVAQAQLHLSNIGEGAPIWWFVDRMYKRLQFELEPLTECPASCGMAAVAFLIRHQNMYYKIGHHLNLDEAEELFREVTRWFSAVDPSWIPGRKLITEAMELERAGPQRLRVGHDSYEFSLLAGMLGIFRPILSHAISELTPQSERLLKDAYRYGLTAWLTARSRRIDEFQFQKRNHRLGESRAQHKIRKSFEEEFECHLKLSNAARDAGEYLEAARQLYLVYRLIPTEFVDSPKVKDELKRRTGTIRYLLEAGLEIDSRFDVDKASPGIQDQIRRLELGRAAGWQTMKDAAATSGGFAARATGKGSTRSSSGAPEETGFMLRVRQDQDRLPEWKTVMEEIGHPSGQTPAGFLLTLMKGLADSGYAASPGTLAAAYRLALRYGYVRSAGKILARALNQDAFVLTPSHLLDFVHSVKRCTQLDPFGIRQERLEEWQALIREGCWNLFLQHGSNWMGASDRLWIHETVTNRTLVHHRGLTFENAQRLYEKATGVYDVEELREFYDLSYAFERRAHGIASVDTVSSYCEQFSGSALGAPSAISLMIFGNAVSIVGIGSDGHVVADDIVINDLPATIESLIAESEYWFKWVDIDSHQQIAWPASFRDLAGRVIAVAKACSPMARVLLVSMDSDLAQLPWQHLIGCEGGEGAPLVSILPNLSAFTLHGATDPLVGFRSILSSEPGEEIASVVEAVRASTLGLDLDSSSVCIVAGHGSLPERGGLPGVNIGANRTIATLDNWMDVLGARIVILHCCHSGVPKPVFMKEFGGVPGLGICLGTETFLAPISEVYSSVATTLQTHIFADPTIEIGIAYLSAITENPACALYNLYGSPYERIISETIPPETVAKKGVSEDQLRGTCAIITSL